MVRIDDVIGESDGADGTRADLEAAGMQALGTLRRRQTFGRQQDNGAAACRVVHVAALQLGLCTLLVVADQVPDPQALDDRRRISEVSFLG